jgi:hypothetical protein
MAMDGGKRPESRRKRTLVPNKWYSEPVSTIWRKEISFASAGTRTPDRSLRKQVIISVPYKTIACRLILINKYVKIWEARGNAVV